MNSSLKFSRKVFPTLFNARSSVLIRQAVQFRSFGKKKGQQVARPSIAELLTAEVETELGHHEIDQDFEEVKKVILENFTIIENPDKTFVELTRKHKNETIMIKFDLKNMTELEYDEEKIAQLQEGEETTYEAVNFNVKVMKGDDTLFFECVAGDKLFIRNVLFIPAGVDTKDGRLFAGRPMQFLEPELQAAFGKYIIERKISEELRQFILMKFNDKEYKSYLKWAENTAQFTLKE
jgi:hypothetical protein